MIIPGKDLLQDSSDTSDSTRLPRKYEEVYVPPASTLWLNLGYSYQNDPDSESSYRRDEYRRYRFYELSLQFRISGVLSGSVDFGQMDQFTAYTTTTSREPGQETRVYSERSDFLFGLGLHAVTSEKDPFALEGALGFTLLPLGSFYILGGVRYQPQSSLRIRLSGQYRGRYTAAVLSIGVTL